MYPKIQEIIPTPLRFHFDFNFVSHSLTKYVDRSKITVFGDKESLTMHLGEVPSSSPTPGTGYLP